MTAIAQCGKPESDEADWTDPELELELDEGAGVMADCAAESDDSEERTEADEAEAAEAEEREATTESAKVVWIAKKMG